MAIDVLGQLVTLRVEPADSDYQRVAKLAREKVRRIDPRAMLLSWHSALTGDFFPKIECGHQDRPPWIVWAASRGANLTVSVNDGAYCFYYLIGALADKGPQRDSRCVP